MYQDAGGDMGSAMDDDASTPGGGAGPKIEETGVFYYRHSSLLTRLHKSACDCTTAKRGRWKVVKDEGGALSRPRCTCVEVLLEVLDRMFKICGNFVC